MLPTVHWSVQQINCKMYGLETNIQFSSFYDLLILAGGRFLVFFYGRRRKLARVPKLPRDLENITPQQNRGPPWQPAERFFVFFENFKSCLWVLKLWKWVLSSWGRCLKVTLQTLVAENFLSCWWGASGGSSVSRHWSEDPHRHERKLQITNLV